MCFSTTLETVPIYSNTAHTVQCRRTSSNIAALLFEETTNHWGRKTLDSHRESATSWEKYLIYIISCHPRKATWLNSLVTPFCCFGVFFWHLSLWNSVWKTTYRERRKTSVPSRLTTTARVLQERMKYPNKAYWAIPTAKNKPPIEPNIQLKTKQNIITSVRNISKSQHMRSDKN